LSLADCGSVRPSLRNDTLEAEIAGSSKHDPTLGDDRFAEQDGVDAGDEPQERPSKSIT
jgi:hypothetical protein